MKIIMKLLLVLTIFIAAALPVSAQVLEAPMYNPDGALDPEDLTQARMQAWNSYSEEMLNNEDFMNEGEANAFSFGEVEMMFTVEVEGDRPENGYPLYIALHGGGSSDTPEKNDSQWDAMQEYYWNALNCGVYVAPRGVRDTYDTHSNPESYPLYDKLIEYMILKYDVDPDRVYIEGFSAGGDGVYQIGARMADRFAAANMSAGHPNSVSMVNFFNLPIQLQVGENDTAYDRHKITAEYGLILDQLQDDYPDGYTHRTLIHCDCGHNFADAYPNPIPVIADPEAWLYDGERSCIDVDSYPPDFMNEFAREPLPQTLVWDLNTRADQRETQAFYYLSADYDAGGTVQVRRDGNDISIQTKDLEGDFLIMFNEEMIDFEQPVHFSLENGELDVLLTPEMYWLEFTTLDRGDPSYQFEAAVSYNWLLENL